MVSTHVMLTEFDSTPHSIHWQNSVLLFMFRRPVCARVLTKLTLFKCITVPCCTLSSAFLFFFWSLVVQNLQTDSHRQGSAAMCVCIKLVFKYFYGKEIRIILKLSSYHKGPVSWPDEVPAVRAVGGLSQVGGHELVSVDLVDPAADGTLALPGTHPLPKHALLILGGACRSCTKTKK